MTTTIHRAVRDLATRLLIGALLLGTLIAVGIRIAQTNPAAALSASSPP